MTAKNSKGRGRTRVKPVTVYEVLATNTGVDLAAYFFPAKATMYPPEEDWNRVKGLCVSH
jgi:hypothetical protein